MRAYPWIVVALVAVASSAWGAQQKPATPKHSLDEGLRLFDRQVSLGAALSVREPKAEELAELQKMGDSGLAYAREWVAEEPNSADAHYLLGSWLLYGYRSALVRTITADATGAPRSETVPKVVQGLADSPDEGLQALSRAHELAPANGRYLLDYAAALADYDRPLQAAGLLKSAWAGQPPLSPEERVRAALLLSDITAAQGDLPGARMWVYNALNQIPGADTAVQRLRWLDAAQAEAAALQAAAAAQQPTQGTGKSSEAGEGYSEGGEGYSEGGEGYSEGSEGYGYDEGGEGYSEGGEGYEGEAEGQQGYDEGG